jgi:hypothetical protein
MDVLCYDDLDELGRDLDDPLAELEQDVVHWLFESFGSNADRPDGSIGLEDALSGPSDPGLRHRIETKLSDDPRIDAVEVKFVQIDPTQVRLDLRIQANQTALGIAIVFDGAGNVRRVTP